MSKIELVEQKIQPVICIRTRTKMEELPNIIGASYMKIMGYLNELNETPADAPYTAYYNLDMQDLDVEMGFPVSKILPENNDLKAREIPASKVATMMYKGAYSGMEQPYNEMFAWITAKGYEQVGIYYEYYYNSPMDVPESELLTKIVIPLK